MTSDLYPEILDDGIDVTRLVGRQLTASDKAAFQRYADAFQIALYWPNVENFRTCVKLYDEIIADPSREAADGSYQDH